MDYIEIIKIINKSNNSLAMLQNLFSYGIKSKHIKYSDDNKNIIIENKISDNRSEYLIRYNDNYYKMIIKKKNYKINDFVTNETIYNMRLKKDNRVDLKINYKVDKYDLVCFLYEKIIEKDWIRHLDPTNRLVGFMLDGRMITK